MIAWAALCLWPVVAIVFYRVWTLPVALSATLIGGYLLLPEGVFYDLPVLPPIDKATVPAFSALILTMAHLSKQPVADAVPGWLPRRPNVLILLMVLAVGAFGTALTNTDVIFAGQFRSGLRVYDSFSILLEIFVILLPFLLARKVLASVEAQKQFLTVLVISAFCYSFLALFEIRMSPQLNRWVYGVFSQGTWIQSLRGGGFRPFVFLHHGLWLAIFFATAAVAAFGAIREESGQRRKYFLLAGIWIFGTLALSNSFGALMIALVLVPVALFMPARLQLMAAACIAGMVLTYPMLRAAELIPIDRIVSFAGSVDPGRAHSFEVRVENEDRLLVRAKERPVFGWGGWGRSRVYDENGRDLTLSDGLWMIVLGQGGWMRYVGQFGLLSVGIFGLFMRRRSYLHPASIAIALALAANLVDLLPNAGISPVTWLLAGALVGCLEKVRQPLAEAAEELALSSGQTRGRRATTPVYRRELTKKTSTEKDKGSTTSRGQTRYRRHDVIHKRHS